MRYYHYISETKVDMLFPQIPPEFLRGVSVELGFDFGIISGKIGGSISPIDTRVAKVKAIEKFLESENQVQNLIQEGAWLKGTFLARSGDLPDCRGLILFAGVYDGTTLILAGSEANLISGSVNSGTDRGWTFMPSLLKNLNQYVSRHYDIIDIDTNDTTKSTLRPSPDTTKLSFPQYSGQLDKILFIRRKYGKTT